MSTDNRFEDKLLYHWIINLVGSYTAFSINLIVTLTLGFLYSFSLVPSTYLLLLFGVVSPIIFTICLYFFLRYGSGGLLNEPFPKVFVSRAGNQLLMIFDICLIIGFALLIYFGPLNYFIFRFLQTIFFPNMLLVFLRVLYVSRLADNDDSQFD